jgi:hemerythrin-like domain-containing protein
MDMMAQLSREHEILRAHLERIESAAAARNADELRACLYAAHDALNDELDGHIATEEAEAFSAIAETMGDGLLTPFYDEHVEIRALRDDIYTQLARGEAPYSLCLRLCELILAHQQREDMMLFPSAREALAR